MSTVSASNPPAVSLVPPPNYRAAGRALLLWLLLPVCVEALSWQGFQLVGSPGLDPSWQAALEMALHFHLSFGSQVVFTYGPLGFLEVGNNLGMTTWYDGMALLALLNAVWMRFALSAAVFYAARRTYGLVAGFLLAIVGVSFASTQFADLVILLIALMWASRKQLEGRDELIFCALAGAGAAVELLEKVSLGATAAVMVAVYALSASRGRRRVPTLTAGASFIVVLVLIWIALGQSLGALPIYVWASYQISSGYSAAMSIAQAGYGWSFTAAFVLGVYGLWAVRHSARDALPLRRAGLVVIWILFWFSAFKEGFVRQDSAHVPVFFGAMVGGLFAFRFAAGQRKLGLAGLATAVCASLASMGLSFGDVVHPAGSVSTMVSDARQLIVPGDRSKLVAETRANVLNAEALPKGSLALLRGHTVALYPIELDVIWAYRLRWSPLPVLQSYSAYTPWLDHKDASFLASARAPSRLIVQSGSGSIDGRFLGFDEPATTLQIFCRYRPLLRTPKYGIFAHTGDRCSKPRAIKTLQASWGETVHVPTPPGRRSLVIAQIIGTQPAGFEKLAGVLFKPDQRGIIINGTADLRLVSGTAADGLPLLTSDGVDYQWPYTVTPEARTIAVTRGSGPQSSTANALTYRFSVVTVRPWASKRRRAGVATVTTNG
jgi:hypothetical protein